MQPSISADFFAGFNSTGSATPYGLTPNQIRGAYYGLGIHGDGSGQTIAIVDAYDDPNALSDLNAFSTYFGLPTFGGSGTPAFEKLNQDGSTSLPGTDREGPWRITGNTTWEMEESLDIEWAHVMAPMANIILFEASNASSGLYAAVQTAANTSGVVAISMSWSGSEFSGETADDPIFVTPSGHVGGAASLGGAGLLGGITFLAATGDSGAYDAQNTSTITPQYPACSPNVVAVGGTSLTVNADNTYGSETSWGNGTSSGTSGGGGGGISVYESQPSYQSGVVNAYSTKVRTYPDVSADANPSSGVPIYDSWDFGGSTPWFPGVIGGTSLSCPLWAGMIAVADQGRAIAGLGSLNGANQTLPQLYQAYKATPTDFHDVTSGNSIGGPAYAPGTGYDLATGLGSPAGASLIPRLIGAAPTVTGISPTVGPLAGGASVTITGTNLAGATAVNFGTTAVTAFISDTGTQIVLNSPAGGAGTVDVTVVTLGGTSATSMADRFSYLAPPTVTNVLVSSTDWNPAFLSYLASLGSQNVGGYSIPVGSGSQLLSLPWGNINQIEVVFSENVAVDQSDLLLSGVNTTAYNVSGGTFSYDPTTFTATWTLPQAIGRDKLLLDLNADGSDPIEDSAGNRLDGEWINPTSTTQSSSSTYPSGNGTAGGDLLFRFNVLPGDANGDGTVNLSDLTIVGQHWEQSGVLGGDFNGDGVVNLSDLTLLGQDWRTRLPSAEPVAGSFSGDALLVAASVPTAVPSALVTSVTPVTTVGTPATSTSNSTDNVVAIAIPGVVASGQVAVPATSSGTEAAVPAMVIAGSSVATSQPAYLVSESQPTAPWSLSAQVSPSQSTVTAAASPATPPGTPLTFTDLKPVVSEAIARWAGAGLNAATPQKLTQLPFVIGDLPGSSLGEAEGNRISLDTNAAGSGWFVDLTPAWNGEVAPSQSNQPLPAVDPRVVDRMDLLTVVEHELGQGAGLNDLDALTDDVMSGVLGSGVCRNVSHQDAVLASL